MIRITRFRSAANRAACIARALLLLFLLAPAASPQDPDYYVKKASWPETILASREALMEKERLEGSGVPLPDFGAAEFTFMAWIRTTSENGAVFAKAPAEGNWEEQGKVFFLRRGALHYDVGWVGAINSEAKVNDGKWRHVALAGKATLNFYVDGKPVKSGDLNRIGSRPVGPDVGNHQVKIGTCTPDFPDDSGFVGEIDEVRIFNRRLSPDEVKAVCENGKEIKFGLIGRWSFDGDASDSSGNEAHGKMIRATFMEGKSGKALRFDGSSSVILPPSSAVAARRRILELVLRDFTAETAAKEIAWEREDGIWKEDWKLKDTGELVRRYAAACRDVGGIPERAAALAASVKSIDGLGPVRDLYLLSRASEEAYGSLKNKIHRMREEVAYLDEKYPPDHKAWNKYKTDLARLIQAAETTAVQSGLGIAKAVEKLKRLESSANKLYSGRPLVLPSGPEGSGRFGAYYTRLKYSMEWDMPWRIGPLADVVVRFDGAPYRFVFWRGTSYIPCWVTGNGIWYTNEFCETSGGSTEGCAEPMSDKQTRYSHVRIIESHPARTVVHWRYALCDVEYRLPHLDPMTGWGDWADEYYTIYPDGVAVREINMRSSKLDHWHEFQEAIIINQPGTRPENNIEFAAVTLANLDGASKDYVWTEDGGPGFGNPEDACIQVINLKAAHRPFAIVPPKGTRITPYRGHAPGSHFNCWDHWPVSMDKNWTRVVKGFDRPSHTSLSHIHWPPYKETDRCVTKLLLNGMTDLPAKALAPLARSWLHPAPLRLMRGDSTLSNVVHEGYDPAQRAYVLSCREPGNPSVIVFTLQASGEAPVINPAFVIKGWGRKDASVTINGADIEKGKGFRNGIRHGVDGSDLIVWVNGRSFKPILVAIIPEN
jgi:hypothetical protein